MILVRKLQMLCLIQKYLNTISEWNEILKHSSVCDMHVCISPKSWKVTCPRFSQTLPRLKATRLFNGSCWRGLRLLRNRGRSRPCWQYILGQLVLSVCYLLFWSNSQLQSYHIGAVNRRRWKFFGRFLYPPPPCQNFDPDLPK